MLSGYVELEWWWQVSATINICSIMIYEWCVIIKKERKFKSKNFVSGLNWSLIKRKSSRTARLNNFGSGHFLNCLLFLVALWIKSWLFPNCSNFNNRLCWAAKSIDPIRRPASSVMHYICITLKRSQTRGQNDQDEKKRKSAGYLDESWTSASRKQWPGQITIWYAS